ncbi:suppressor of cytokine signaling 1a [Pholidichthys leucotaenia]
MVAGSSVESHDKSQLSPSRSPSSSSSFSSSSSLLSSSSFTSSLSSSSSSSSATPRTESQQLQRRANPNRRSVPSVYLTHFPTFSCKEDCKIITDTAAKLERCGFYWGPLEVEDAHHMLRDAPLGSFLIRDSRQKNVFFTLSYHTKGGPVSVRIEYKGQKFSLAGNERSFPTLFDLLEHYINSPKKCLTAPYRKWEPTLQERCRKCIVELCSGKNRLSELPLTHVAREFLMEFPYKL